MNTDTAGLDKCQCTFAIRMTGEGCRYCQPQNYIDHLHDAIVEEHKERDELEASVSRMQGKLRVTLEALSALMNDWDEYAMWPQGQPLDGVRLAMKALIGDSNE